MLWSILPLDLKMMVYDHIAPDDKRAFRYVDKITYQTFRHRVNLAAPKTRDAVTTLLRFDHYSHFGTEATLGDALLRRATHTGITLPCDARAESSGSSEGQRGAQRVLAAMPSYTQLMLTIPRFPSLVQELVDGATGTDLDIAAARWIAGRAELGFTTPFYVNLPPALERSALGSWIATTLGGEVWRTVSREKQEECPESSLAASQSHASNVRAQDPVVCSGSRETYRSQLRQGCAPALRSTDYRSLFRHRRQPYRPKTTRRLGQIIPGPVREFFCPQWLPDGHGTVGARGLATNEENSPRRPSRSDMRRWPATLIDDAYVSQQRDPHVAASDRG
ncbi:hypothetical protein IE81DRAFT_47996 [Ceraceosorus guamensis]|uniref:Uncharacterized protein n=1 Tax=Ceraceosorus guamensis TaxID=1522189 RepID=A0A316W321_9BASI|nr:hypothetical protein IE81DRAFT_47996 [Ceraceosorus guamensis]PWN44112.1 hypothetical protein IE81DRAFT_47996 [Ceraceosorus guamensis]